MSTPNETTKNEQLLRDDDIEFSVQLRDLINTADDYLASIDKMAGERIGTTEGLAGMHWRLSRTMVTRQDEAARLTGCIFGLSALAKVPEVLTVVPGLLHRALVEHHPDLEHLLMSDEIIVDMIPMLAEYLRTDGGKAHLERLIEQRRADSDGDDHA